MHLVLLSLRWNALAARGFAVPCSMFVAVYMVSALIPQTAIAEAVTVRLTIQQSKIIRH